ncbi:MAG: hypothetical protein CM1200mP16_02800 [Nitrospina sp.]|nr:MAG: hypothetical protein CM1200mP16_02800 [Nitrospina sp.]
MTKVEKIVQALTQEGSLIFASNLSFAGKNGENIPNLKVEEKNDCDSGLKTIPPPSPTLG